MSDDELKKIRLRKNQFLLRFQSMPKEIVEVFSLHEYEQLLSDYPDKIIIIDFWAVWCGPCMTFAPVFQKLQQEYPHDFIFVKVNVDQQPEISSMYRITSIPTTLFIRNGEYFNKVVGIMNYTNFKNFLEKLKNDYN